MILSLKAENFRSFPELAYTVEHSGLVAVGGQWDGSEDRSNGAGKSSFLPDLVCWALYGETVGGDTKVCYEGMDAGCKVELKTPFVSLTRSQRADGTGNKLKIEGIDHRRLADAEAYLSRLVPPKKVFCSTVVLGQGVGERFSGWKPAERATVLSELLALSVWQGARKLLSGDARSYADQQARASAAADALSQQSEAMMASVAGGDIDTGALRTELAELESLIAYHGPELARYRTEAAQEQTDQAKVQAHIAGLKGKIASLDQQITRISSGSCPTCGRKWPKKTLETDAQVLQKAKADLAPQLAESEYQLRTAPGRLRCIMNHLRSHEEAVTKTQPRIQQLREALARAEGIEEQAVALLGRAEEARKQANVAQSELGYLQTLDRAFREIPLRKIDGVLSMMNRGLVEVCQRVWENEFLVQLTSNKELKGGGYAPEIGLSVVNKAGSYSGSSWGQRRMIDLSVQLTLRKMLLASWRGALPLLVCDDVTDALDQHAKVQLCQQVLVPESRDSAVFVLCADETFLPRLAHRVVIGYTPSSGSYVRASEQVLADAVPPICFGPVGTVQ